LHKDLQEFRVIPEPYH